MVSEPIPLFPVQAVDPERFADAQHDQFEGKRLRIGRSDTVHAVTWAEWINGLTLPAPACHQGWSGIGSGGELTSTEHEVTCRKCRRLVGIGSDPAQRALFPLP